MFAVGPGNFPLTRPKNSCSMYFFIFHHEEDLSNHFVRRGSYQKIKLDTSDSNSPPQLEIVRLRRKCDGARGLLGGDVEDLNRPFRSFPGPLFQNESRCSAFDMEIIFHSRPDKTHFHKKDCACSIILKLRIFGTRKWPIDRRITSAKAK